MGAGMDLHGLVPGGGRAPRVVVGVGESGRIRTAVPGRRPARPRPRLRGLAPARPAAGLAVAPTGPLPGGHARRLGPLLRRGRRAGPSAAPPPLAAAPRRARRPVAPGP